MGGNEIDGVASASSARAVKRIPNAESRAAITEIAAISDAQRPAEADRGGNGERVRSYRDLKVWQKGMALAELVYALSRHMPKEEQYRMTSQMLRSATSVPANIAEGYQRGTRRDYAHFISIARGSLAETETFLLLASRVGLLSASAVAECLELANQLSRMLRKLRARLVE